MTARPMTAMSPMASMIRERNTRRVNPTQPQRSVAGDFRVPSAASPGLRSIDPPNLPT